MALPTKKLTDLKVLKAKGPGYLNDGSGLYLQISPAGTKSWVLRYQIHKRSREMGLGKYPDVGLKEARIDVEKYRLLIARKIDPIDSRRDEWQQGRVAAAKFMTFGQCCEQYIDAHRSEWRNAKHAAQWDATLRNYCKPLWDLGVEAIDTQLVEKCLVPIWTTKTETATRVRGRIEKVLGWATVRGFRSGDNPARWNGHLKELLAKRVKKPKHRAALPYAQSSDFMAALRARNTLAARALELQILTATRPGEATGAQWDEFNLDDAIWIIPAERMKGHKEHRVPLSPAALSMVKSLARVAPSIFPGVKGRSLTTAAGMKLLKELQPDITAHGFRSTFRDWAAETTQHPREVIEAAMSHRLKDASEAAYQRGDLLVRRAKLMADWARYCAGR